MPRLNMFGCLVVFLLSISNVAQAGVVVGATRVIYDGKKKEASISVANADKSTPFLIQSWFEVDEGVHQETLPFIITPPLFRLDVGRENILRIVRVGNQLPKDREAVYWLNIKSIPATEESTLNKLQISVKTRIKLFYRPVGLPGNANEAHKLLVFSKNNGRLIATNPTPYHISFFKINIGSEEIKDVGMVEPFSTREWAIPDGSAGDISWQSINDYGGITDMVKQ
ncbi:molecular chaperone [Pseudomonas sp. Irchel s3a12]|uniref:fimbrial biogenesis chaperone n=1 Tax=Pseudomonas sp. Irchel s3a12 TaxID=2009047 RepID=UPI002115BD1D|nr:molecular chaperone [Pseudomonas sp. Irchel s3a12]